MPPDAEPSAGQPHWTLPTEAGRPCPYCRTPLRAEEQVVVCPACRVPHHLECWIDNGRCTTYGCREVAAPGLWRRLEERRPFLSLQTFRPQRPERRDTFDMVAYGLVLVFGWLLGPLALLLSFDLLEYLRRHPELPAPRRRKLLILARIGTAIGLVWVVVAIAGLASFLILLPTLIK